jgi:hypothetical protein
MNYDKMEKEMENIMKKHNIFIKNKIKIFIEENNHYFPENSAMHKHIKSESNDNFIEKIKEKLENFLKMFNSTTTIEGQIVFYAEEKRYYASNKLMVTKYSIRIEYTSE